MHPKLTIAFYLDNKTIPNANLSEPEKGNPGVGGTQFYCVAVPYYIQKYLNAKYNVVLYSHHTSSLPQSLNIIKVSSFYEAFMNALENEVSILVFRPKFSIDYQKVYQLRRGNTLSLIAWGHNILSNSQLTLLNNCHYIKLLLCVSREQYDQIRDHDIFNKSSFLENPFDSSSFPDTTSLAKEKIVTYIGSLIPSKGFHRLAQMWPLILQKQPDAQLMVIGSGSLYNEKTKLGQLGIAEESYERRFSKYLLDDNGKLKNSVHFLGKMGAEKIDVFKKTRVGVPNPTGRTENCPGSAIEFQACGIPVVSARKFGLLDTVMDKRTGFLSNNLHKQVDLIVKLLEDDILREKMGKEAIAFIDSKFNPKVIVDTWDYLLTMIIEKNLFSPRSVSPYYFNNYKPIRVINSRLKKLLPFLPSLLWYEELIKRTGRKVVKKLNF